MWGGSLGVVHPNPSFLVAPQIQRHGSVGGGAIFTLGIESAKWLAAQAPNELINWLNFFF